MVLMIACGGNPHLTESSWTGGNIEQLTPDVSAKPPKDNPVKPTDPGSNPDPIPVDPPTPPEDTCVTNIGKYPEEKDHLKFPNDGYYELYNLHQLRSLAADKGAWGKNYKLMANLNLTRWYVLNPDKYFSIGSKRRPYTGTFDGNHCTITGFQYTGKKVLLGLIKRSRGGLFTRLKGAHIRNLRLEQGIIAGDHIGMLATKVENSVLEKIVLSGTTAGSGKVGMLASSMKDTLVKQVGVKNFFVRGGKFVGGLVGDARNVNFIQTYAMHGHIMGKKSVGGMVGRLRGSKLIEGYSKTWIQTEKKNGGGIVGESKGSLFQYLSTLSDVYSPKGIHIIVPKKKDITWDGLYHWKGLVCSDCALGMSNEITDEQEFYSENGEMYKDWSLEAWTFQENELPGLAFEKNKD